MRSERGLHQHPVAVWLASVRVGIPVMLAACALLATSSVLAPAPRSKDHLPFSESFGPFVDTPGWSWWWFYLLFVVMLAIGLTTAFGTWRPLAVRWAHRSRVGARLWGITLMHIAFLGALLAQGLAGLSAGVERGAVIGPELVALGGHSFRLESWTPVSNSDGTLKTGTAEIRDGERLRRLGYNQPLWLDGLRRSVLLQDVVQVPGAVRLRVGGEHVEVLSGGVVQSGAGVVRVAKISTHESLSQPMVQVTVGGGDPRWVAPGWEIAEGVMLDGVVPAWAARVVLRRNDGVPVLFGSMGVFVVGALLFVWGRRRSGR